LARGAEQAERGELVDVDELREMIEVRRQAKAS
jgi:hypothetical protein